MKRSLFTMEYPRPAQDMRRRGRRAGFTLLELLIVCVVLGIVCTMGALRLRDVLRERQVHHARTAMTQLLNAARAAAIRAGQPAQLQITGGTRIVALLGPGRSRSVAFDSLDLVSSYNVSLTPPSASIAYDARGLANGNASVTFVFTHALGGRDSLCVSPLGLARRHKCSS